MNTTHFTLTIRIDFLAGDAIVLESVSSDITAGELIGQLLSTLGFSVDEQEWCLVYQSSVLPLEVPLRSSLPATTEPIQLVFIRLTAATAQMAGPPTDRSGVEMATWQTSIPDSDEEIDLCLSMEEEALDGGLDLEPIDCDDDAPEEAEEAESIPTRSAAMATSARARKAVARRATVRYYSRMNPERVYPLLVLITKDLVEKVRKKDTDQRTTDPFQVHVDTPIEIEPVLPGCDCYPPKILSRFTGDDMTATFRIVPRVVSRVDGASVTIRQDHNQLAEITLDVRVVQRVWVLFIGVMTFVLPGISAIMKHFGLDFETQKDQGFSLYLNAAHLVFDQLSPLALTTGLGLGTVVLWWFSRPQIRDVFWDIKKVSPEAKLEQIVISMESHPRQASQDLTELLKAFPDYQPAHLFQAEQHYKNDNYRAALIQYQKSFKFGVAEPRHYHEASSPPRNWGKTRWHYRSFRRRRGYCLLTR